MGVKNSWTGNNEGHVSQENEIKFLIA